MLCLAQHTTIDAALQQLKTFTSRPFRLRLFSDHHHSMQINTLILGAGAAGMMAAANAGPGVLVVDHAKAAGEKIRISGGGRCNFTNTGTTPDNFICKNPHFAKSALSRYTQWDFITLVSDYDIQWHE